MTDKQTEKLSHAEMLYKLMPAVYRAKDNGSQGNTIDKSEGDLNKLLSVFGGLLDEISANIDQFYADNFPFNSSSVGGDGEPSALGENQDLSCQPWLLPYFSDLLDVNLVSPDAKGQSREIANAVRWRQRRGTIVATEEIAQNIGDMEVEVQEGWKRVAMTPRIDAPLAPESSFGEDEVDSSKPLCAAKHPGLLNTTVDVRKYSLAVKADQATSETRVSRFSCEGGGMGDVLWIQKNRSAIPLYQGSYQDQSRRTVDVRTPNWKTGHANPRSVLLYCPVPQGYFVDGADKISWNDIGSSNVVEVIKENIELEGRTVEKITYRGNFEKADQQIQISDKVSLKQNKIYQFENLVFTKEIDAKKINISFINCAVKEVNITSVDNQLIPALDAVNSIFEEVYLKEGAARFEYCTVMQKAITPEIQASDCIFSGTLRRDKTASNKKIDGCIRYSCLPAADCKRMPSLMFNCTDKAPLFFTTSFAEIGCGVIHPAAAEQIKFGAENGGEIGVYHQQRYCLRYEAVILKIKESLPVGLKVALIPDETLGREPVSL
ncbi:MAG: hypothetical protein D6B28_08590 [Gammaproteobacteria bacterium]|nr:MAG: hypothetical protein D6B28_08590 [Gammaproteobacteria bacterium]